MKRTLFFIAFMLALWTLEAQKVTREERFLGKYEAFVSEVVSTPVGDIHGDTLQHYKKTQRCFMRRYRWFYDTRLSVDQLEEFNKLCGRYNRKMTSVNRHRRWVATKGRIQGRWEGLFKRRDIPEDTLVFDTIDILYD